MVLCNKGCREEEDSILHHHDHDYISGTGVEERKDDDWNEAVNIAKMKFRFGERRKRLKPALRGTNGRYLSAERPRPRSKYRRGFHIRQVTFAEDTIFVNRRSNFKRPAVKRLPYEEKRYLRVSRPDLDLSQALSRMRYFL